MFVFLNQKRRIKGPPRISLNICMKNIRCRPLPKSHVAENSRNKSKAVIGGKHRDIQGIQKILIIQYLFVNQIKDDRPLFFFNLKQHEKSCL